MSEWGQTLIWIKGKAKQVNQTGNQPLRPTQGLRIRCAPGAGKLSVAEASEGKKLKVLTGKIHEKKQLVEFEKKNSSVWKKQVKRKRSPRTGVFAGLGKPMRIELACSLQKGRR